MENDARNLMDADGENMAVRYFLDGYQMGVNRIDGMREHLANFGLPYWPDWAATESGHITKTEAQNWLRYLFSLEGASEVERLRAELETERMRLVACSVIALANTPESAASARDMHPDYQSPSCDDVARAIDREIALRSELAECRDALAKIGPYYVPSTELSDDEVNAMYAMIDAARKGEEDV